MTGIGMVAAAGSSSVVTTPFTVGVSFTGGAGPINVSGASGNLYTAGGWVIFADSSGGVLPYTGPGVTLSSNPSGKISVVPAGDGVHNTLAWSGFSVGELEGCVLRNRLTDNVGTVATAFYPTSGSLVIQRTV